ncbi:MAG TPA: protein kinase [Ideonella sp.]|uniref:protein kinase domain-containing protein n=1 Tax=Ideonella sp. TaxID=1929293 RepID=UPI002E2EF075|nr:protein kinase [Ideonella sp.]HEX5686599.1 protein kinase [Ideonella sp.]
MPAPASSDEPTDRPGPAAPGTNGASPPEPDDDATRIAPVRHAAVKPPVQREIPRVHAGETLPGGAQAADPTMRQVGRYEIRERLGRGGMATVFRAHDPQIGRDVAIKFLHASLCEDDEYRSRFLREARAAGGLSHPNIVTVHDVGEIEGRPYMAMELLAGDSLSDLMPGGHLLPLREVVIIGIQLARALDYAHARGIVHRDIKPGNIMRLKGTQTIKVTDFGIAHMDATVTGGEQRTRVGDILGTPQYMSPEQTQGEKIDGRSDLFSAGIVLYQLLTGQRPFQGDSLVTLALKIAKEDPPPMEKLRPGLPASLRRVVERCLAKAPDRRFATGRELADALSRVLVGIDEAARGENKPRIVPLRVKWAATMALVVAVVMGLTASVITQRQYAAMMGQVSDSGAALARFIAAQNAVSALAEDWVVVDVALQEIMKTKDFDSVAVIDRQGVVRAASDPAQVGQAFQAPPGESLGTRSGGVVVSRYRAHDEPMLGFESPITFQGKQVGRVALGLPEKPLERVAQLSMVLMAVLVVVTVLAVAVAMYFVANWFAKPIQLLSDSMDEIAKGRFDYRIREQRKDEFGLLYVAFDRMAQALQSLSGGEMATPTGMSGPETPVRVGSAPLPTAARAAATDEVEPHTSARSGQGPA